jgi:hypothetical protein
MLRREASMALAFRTFNSGMLMRSPHCAESAAPDRQSGSEDVDGSREAASALLTFVVSYQFAGIPIPAYFFVFGRPGADHSRELYVWIMNVGCHQHYGCSSVSR